MHDHLIRKNTRVLLDHDLVNRERLEVGDDGPSERVGEREGDAVNDEGDARGGEVRDGDLEGAAVRGRGRHEREGGLNLEVHGEGGGERGLVRGTSGMNGAGGSVPWSIRCVATCGWCRGVSCGDGERQTTRRALGTT